MQSVFVVRRVRAHSTAVNSGYMPLAHGYSVPELDTKQVGDKTVSHQLFHTAHLNRPDIGPCNLLVWYTEPTRAPELNTKQVSDVL